MTKNKLWFKAKNYGWGLYPVSREGWLVTGVYLLIVFGSSILLAPQNNIQISLLSHLGIILVSTVALIWICYKTGEKPEWRWGGKKIK